MGVPFRINRFMKSKSEPVFYTVYKTTNIENGMTYVGVHKTSDLADGYLGSGTAILKAIAEYGKGSFRKEYLAVFDNPDEMIAMESAVVNRAFVDDPETYNVRTGGVGRYQEGYVNYSKVWKNGMEGKHHTDEAKTIKREKSKRWRANLCEEDKGELHRKIREGVAKSGIWGKSFLGKSHTEESKQLMSEAGKKRIGAKNPSYGSRWLNKDGVEEKVSAQEVDSLLEQGWAFGRINKPPLSKKKASSEGKGTRQKRQVKNPEKKGRFVKVTDEELLKALLSHSSIRQALLSVDLPGAGKSYERAKRLLKVSGKLPTRGFDPRK